MVDFDTFSEDGVYLTTEDKNDVLYKGLWHKVIRVWLFDLEGNIYLRKRKVDGKLDCVNELDLLSTESATSCFDRGMFVRFGIHFPSTAKLILVDQKKYKIHKVYSDNSELRNNYFLCNYIGEFDNNIGYYIFDDETSGIVKVNARGLLSLIKSRTGERICYSVNPSGAFEGEKSTITIDDIFEDKNNNLYDKYSLVCNQILSETQLFEKNKREEEKLQKYTSKKNDEDFVSNADKNEGTEVY